MIAALPSNTTKHTPDGLLDERPQKRRPEDKQPFDGQIDVQHLAITVARHGDGAYTTSAASKCGSLVHPGIYDLAEGQSRTTRCKVRRVQGD